MAKNRDYQPHYLSGILNDKILANHRHIHTCDKLRIEWDKSKINVCLSWTPQTCLRNPWSINREWLKGEVFISCFRDRLASD